MYKHTIAGAEMQRKGAAEKSLKKSKLGVDNAVELWYINRAPDGRQAVENENLKKFKKVLDNRMTAC